MAALFEAGDVPAFPTTAPYHIQGGMTLRDWFAGQALAGIIHGSAGSGLEYDVSEAAEDAYKVADAMIAQGRTPTAPATLSRSREE
jgi:hypothetical protein